MISINTIKEQAINQFFNDFKTEDLFRLTPFQPISTISRYKDREIRKELISHYLEVVLHEQSFLKQVRDNKNDSYDLLFETYNFSYGFYCGALERSSRVRSISIDLYYFSKLYQNKDQGISFNPLKENLFHILKSNHEQTKIILS